MRRLVAIGLFSIGLVLGAVIESRTHALKVSRITGAPLLQVLGPVTRALDDDEEVCSIDGKSVDCEANQN